MGAFLRWIGPSGLATIMAVVGVAGWYGVQKAQIWWQKDRRAYCEAKLTDYELKSKAALEKITLERDALKARLENTNHEHKARLATMRARHDRAFDSLSHAYQDSCSRLSQAAATARGNDGGTGGDQLRQGTGERLARVARIADEQAERLLYCQSYVSSLQGK